jgi:hypothetical protein
MVIEAGEDRSVGLGFEADVAGQPGGNSRRRDPSLLFSSCAQDA